MVDERMKIQFFIQYTTPGFAIFNDARNRFRFRK